ncbi:MAG: hypothetical protein ACLQHF_12480 [Terracidiphilus sp.]
MASGAAALFALAAANPLCAQASQEQQSPAALSPAAPANGTDSSSAGPIAIVTVNGPDASANPTVTGALEISGGKAMIAASGSITAGDRTTTVILPHRGTLRVCATTTVKLAADSSDPAGDAPGLLMALDHGALETSYATGQNADIILTPHFRILIGGPGASELKVRLGDDGDTCVDNAGANAPYVVVTSLFEGGLYRVQPGQRVMFQHGSLGQVVDSEKEPCGCPPPPSNAGGNEFPLAQSEGLAPSPAIAPTPAQPANLSPATTVPLIHNSLPTPAEAAPAPPSTPALAASQASATATPAPQKKKPGFFTRVGNFFKKIFGAE